MTDRSPPSIAPAELERLYKQLDRIATEDGGRMRQKPSATEKASQFAAYIAWTRDTPLLPGRAHILRSGTTSVVATVTELKYKVTPDSLEHLAAKTLQSGEIGFCNLALSEPIDFDCGDDSCGFYLSNRAGTETLGVGRIQFGLRRATNVVWQTLHLDKEARALRNGHRPAILWFTGLSGSGKSTIANAVEQRLYGIGAHTYLLDGDNVRHGLNQDLGFTDADRVENIRRVAEVAKLFVDAGLIVIVAFISPFRAERRMARELVADGEFLEVFVDTPIEECKKRDPKGLYKRAEAGEIKNFTGIDSPYEAPEHPELHLKTAGKRPEALVEVVLNDLTGRKIVDGIVS
jgi:bifunctional enzyme CysN/CysC